MTPTPKPSAKARKEPYVLYSFGWGRECCISTTTGKMFFRNRPKAKAATP